MKKACLSLVLLLHLFLLHAQTETSVGGERGTLPVMFDSVRAIIKNDRVYIGWSNLTEREVKVYTIERSVNAKDFVPVYQQPPASNRDEKAAYICADIKPLDGVSFYRIRVSINSGRIVTSRILKTEMNFKTSGFTLYPNPVTGDECTISLASVQKGKYTLEVINNAGLRLKQATLNNQGTGVTESLILPAGMRAGVYVVRIKGEGYMASQLFVKK